MILSLSGEFRFALCTAIRTGPTTYFGCTFDRNNSPLSKLKDGHLMAQGQNLPLNMASVVEAGTERGEQAINHSNHGRRSSSLHSANFNVFTANEVYGRHRFKSPLRHSPFSSFRNQLPGILSLTAFPCLTRQKRNEPCENRFCVGVHVPRQAGRQQRADVGRKLSVAHLVGEVLFVLCPRYS